MNIPVVLPLRVIRTTDDERRPQLSAHTNSEFWMNLLKGVVQDVDIEVNQRLIFQVALNHSSPLIQISYEFATLPVELT